MVVIADRLSHFASKGEVVERYYNPGDLFEEVHLVFINDDEPPKKAAQKMVGNADLHIHNLPLPSFLRTLGWQTQLLKPWISEGVALAKEVDPSLIRCHGGFLNGLLCAEIKKQLGIPYALSLHINPDEDMHGRTHTIKERLVSMAIHRIEETALRNSDRVLPVYQPIIPYLERLGVTKYEVAYNVINPKHLRKKTSYSLNSPIKIISVGRQFKERNPEHLIRALKNLPNVKLTLVGDGPLHQYLRQVSKEQKLDGQIVFIKSIPNDELCTSLPNYDIFAIHTEYWELNKSLIEAMLTGLPCIVNRRKGQAVPELNSSLLEIVENSTAGYQDAIARLISNEDYRVKVATAGLKHARANWAPEITEANFCRIYRELLGNSESHVDS